MNSLVLLTVVASLISSTLGHAYFSNLIVNGVANEACIRPHPSSKYDYPLSDITNPSGLQSTYMTCGWTGKTLTAKSKCPVAAGSTISLQWHYEMGLGSSDTFIIDPSHRGPCLVYMARSDTGTGPVWFKIFEDGYNPSTKQFCVDKLRANKGVFDVKIPADLAPGNYLLRGELIALHEGFELGGAQPYAHCAELTITGSGTSIPSTNLVSFPGAYQANDPGLFFDIYDGFKSYPIPGPKIYQSGNAPAPTPTPAPTPVPSTTGKKASNTPSTTGAKIVTPSTTGSRIVTTGARTVTTGARIVTPSTTGRARGAVTTGAIQNDDDCHTGDQRCTGDRTFQTCVHGRRSNFWSDEQRCRRGQSCVQSGDDIDCE